MKQKCRNSFVLLFAGLELIVNEKMPPQVKIPLIYGGFRKVRPGCGGSLDLSGNIGNGIHKDKCIDPIRPGILS